MAKTWYSIGRQVGTKMRHGLWVWKRLTAGETQARNAETALGRDLAAQLRSQHSPVEDDDAHSLLEEIGVRLANRLKDKRRPWHFEVLGGDDVNACALPGGYIFVTESLGQLCEWDAAELAFVIAHEMAHVVRGHTWDRVVGSAVFSALAHRLGGPLGQLSREFLDKAYSRDRELEADAFALRLMTAAGYSHDGATHLLQRLAQLNPDQHTHLSGYFATHPATRERIKRLHASD